MVNINKNLGSQKDANLDTELEKLYQTLRANPNENDIPNDIKSAIIKSHISRITTDEDFEDVKKL